MSHDYNNSQLEDRAWALIRLDRPEQAIPLLTRALEQDPEDVRILCGLSAAFAEMDDWTRGLEYANRAIYADPAESWGYQRRSLCLSCLGQKEAALEAAEAAIALEPEEPLNLRRLSGALKDCNRLREAEETARKLLDVLPDQGSSHAEMADILFLQKRYAEAEAYYHRALEIEPNYALAMYNLGVSLSRQGREQDVVECYYQAVRLDPSDTMAQQALESALDRQCYTSLREYLASREDSTLQAQVQRRADLKKQGQALMERNEFGQAIVRFQEALRLSPDQPGLLASLAYAYEKQNDLRRALEYADRAVRVAPKNYIGHWRRSSILQKMSQSSKPFRTALLQDALDAIQEAIRLSPQNQSLLVRLCWFQREVKQWKAAEATAKKLIEIAPRWSQSYAQMAFVYQEQTYWSLAEIYHRKALECEPENASLMNNIGVALFYQNRKREAREYFTRASALDPAEPLYQDNIDRAHPLPWLRLLPLMQRRPWP